MHDIDFINIPATSLFLSAISRPRQFSTPSIESIKGTMVGKSSRHFASNSRIPENPFHEANPALFFCGLHVYIYIYTLEVVQRGHVYRFLKSSHNVGDGRAQDALENLAMEKGKPRIGRNLWDARFLDASFSPFLALFGLLFLSLFLYSSFLPLPWLFIAFSFYQVISYKGNL